MDMNWYMKKMLVTDHQNTLLAAAEVHRLRQQARRPRWTLRPRRTPEYTAERTSERTPERTAARTVERTAERAAVRRAAAVPCLPTWHS